MKREIKFRAWDKENQKMYFVDRIDWTRDSSAIFYLGIQEAGFDMTEVPASDFELMQFTGLTDKNGKEIYEGDIVKPREKRRPYDPTEPVEVKFDKGFYAPFAQEGGLDGDYAWDAEQSEVIGNVWENPELYV